MKANRWINASCIAAMAFCAGGAGVVQAQEQAAEAPQAVTEIPVQDMVPAEQIEKVNAAIPAEARVKPASPRKLLIFTKTAGFRHKSIEIGAYSIKKMGEQTGAFTGFITDNPQAFEKEFLSQFDGVLMLNTTMTLFEDAVLQQNLLDFVASGKGIAGIHAATDCFYDWADYGKLMGGYFDGHPWGSGDTVTVRVDDPLHPLVEVFHNRDYVVTDEIYQLKEPYSRENLRILLTLNTEKTDMTKDGIKRTDGDFAVSWVRSYQEGRVYYCSLGHNEHIYWDPTITKYYLDGIQFALGDLEADTMPSAQLPADYFKKASAEAQIKAVESLVDAAAAYDIGKPEADVVALRETVTEYAKDEKVRAVLEDGIQEILGSGASFAAKDVAAKELFRIGTAASVPALAKLLDDEKLADVARYGLERNPTPEATAALVDALSKSDGLARAGIINSLGERRDPAAIAAVAKYLEAKPDDVAGAAMFALAKIGGSEAFRALAGAAEHAPEALEETANQALLAIAHDFADKGNVAVAQKLFDDMFVDKPNHIQFAAFTGLMQVNPARAEEAIPNLLVADNPDMRRLGGMAVAALPGDLSKYGEMLPGLPSDSRSAVVRALGERKDPALLPYILIAAKDDDAEARQSALEALGKAGDASVVAVLAEAAAKDERALAETARTSLDRLSAEGVDEAMAAALSEASPAARAEIAQSLSRRRSESAVRALLAAAQDTDEATRTAAFDALAVLAKGDVAPALVGLLAATEGNSARAAAEQAVIASSNRIDDEAKRAEAIIAAINCESTATASKVTLVRTLSGIGTAQALDAARAAMTCDDAAMKEAGVRALAAWPTGAPLDDLIQLAATDNDTMKPIALRGALELLKRPSDRDAESTAQQYKTVLDLAGQPDDIKLALSGIQDVRHPSVIEIVKPYLDNDAVKAEAQLVVDALEKVTMEASASANGDSAGLALDGDLATRWATGESQSDGQWFQVDLGWERTVNCIHLDATGSNGDYPRKYEVYVSNSAEGGVTPVAAGDGDGPVINIQFEPKAGRYVRIVQKGSDGLWWSIHEITIDTDA